MTEPTKCADGEHDPVFSDVQPYYMDSQPGKANPIRVYWICTKCRTHGALLIRTDHSLFERLVDSYDRDKQYDNQWTVEQYAEHFLARRNKFADVLPVEFALGTVELIRKDMEAEIERRVHESMWQITIARAAAERQMRATKTTIGLIYFIRNIDNGLIKIGTTTNLTDRLSALRMQGGLHLELLGTIPGGRDEERSLHGQFAAHRIRGEWFKPDPLLLTWIAKHAEVSVGV